MSKQKQMSRLQQAIVENVLNRVATRLNAEPGTKASFSTKGKYTITVIKDGKEKEQEKKEEDGGK